MMLDRYKLHSGMSIFLVLACMLSLNVHAFTQFNPIQTSLPGEKTHQLIKSGNSFSIEKFNSQGEDSPYQQLLLSHKRESGNLRVETHFEADYLNDDNSLSTDAPVINVKSLYMNVSNSRYGLASRLGRQQFNLAGHNYAVDGLTVKLPLLGRHGLKMLAGYNYQDPSNLEIDTDETIYGMSAEFVEVAKYFQADAYAYQIQQNEQSERQIYGSRLRYLNDKHSALLQVDFDPSDQAAHSGHLVFETKPFAKQTMKLSVDYRTPAAHGQLAVAALEELQKLFDDSERELLRREADAVYRSGALSWMHEISADIALKSELSVATLDHSELIESSEDNSLYLYGMQLTGNSFFIPKNTMSMAIKYTDFAGAERVAVSVNNRLPLHRHWYADLNLDAFWENSEEMLFSRGISPKLVFNFQQKDNSNLGFEFGYLHLEDNDINTREGDIFFKVTQSLFLW